MALKICKNHPGRDAIGHCATCHIPLCAECAVRTPSLPKFIFCSEEHMRSFVEHLQSPVGRIRRLRHPGFLRNLFSWATTAAVIYLLLHIMGWVPDYSGLPLYNLF